MIAPHVTILRVDDWCGVWVDAHEGEGPELVSEGHSFSVIELGDMMGSIIPFTIDARWVDGTKADHEVSNSGGFRGIALDKWLSLAEER